MGKPISPFVVLGDFSLIHELRDKGYSLDEVTVLFAESIKLALQISELLLLGSHGLVLIGSHELLLVNLSFGSSSFGGHFAEIGPSTFQG